MNTNVENYICRTGSVEWKPLAETGVNTNGIFVKSLRRDEQTKRSPAILLKFEPGAEYPYHNHPGGEEVFVLQGTATIAGAQLAAGDYMYTPRNFKHSVTTETGCVLLFIVPEEVEIL